MGAREQVGGEEIVVGSAATSSAGVGTWENEVPTRPVRVVPPRDADPGADASPGPSDGYEFVPLTLEKACAELTFDDLRAHAPPAPAGSVAPSVSVAFDPDGPAFESPRKSAPSLHEVNAERIERNREAPRPHRSIARTILALSIGAALLAAGATARVGSAATTGRTGRFAAAMMSTATKAVAAARAFVEAPPARAEATNVSPAAAHDDAARPEPGQSTR